jgi:Co/Zn/Cd efflux system component
MMMVGGMALLANLACVALLARHRNGGVHLKASWIFTTNDALANIGVMVAGGLVWWTGTSIPDLVIGGLVGLLVLSGSVRILRMTASTSGGNGA